VCSCFSVTEATIRAAIAEMGLTSAAEIGAVLRAGTNCGSCVPELKKILASGVLAEAS
jgi:assimilatory nitrate reductase catalytic subunit